MGQELKAITTFLKSFNWKWSKSPIKALFVELTKNKTQNRNGSFMAQYLQMYEQRLLQLLYDAALEKNLITQTDSAICLCHDGAMVLKSMFGEEITIEAFIDFLNKKVLDDTGMDIKFKSKAFDEYEEIEKICSEMIAEVNKSTGATLRT